MLSYLKSLFASKQKVKPIEGLQGVDFVDANLHNLCAEQKVPGISCTLIKNGKTLLQKGYGFCDLEEKEAIQPESTLFRIASISKCITGLAFGKMVEEGILNWDDSFYKHVPYYPKKRWDFTLRQLASHTAGIRGYRGKEFALNKSYSIKESIAIFKDDPLVFEPGKGYLYNSFDFVLLSLAMQEASGVSFEDYVQEKVLQPLGMNHTIPPPDNEPLSQESREIILAENYTKRTSGFIKAIDVDNFYKSAGGGYLSTSMDIAKMGQAILEQILLKQETFNELFTPATLNGESTYYGLGFQSSFDLEGRPFMGHVGNSVGAYTNFYVYPKEQLVISILMNCTDPKVQKELDGAISSLFSTDELL